MAIEYQTQDTIQMEVEFEQEENLRNEIRSEYNENSNVLNPVTSTNKNPADQYHFWEKHPNFLGVDFDPNKEKKNQKESVHDFGKWYNYFLDDSMGMAKPQEFIDENWNNDYNGDKSIQDALKDVQKVKNDNLDRMKKLMARKSFLQEIQNEYDIPDYLKNLAKPLLHGQTAVTNNVSQEVLGYLDLTESEKIENIEGNMTDSMIELETDFRRVMENNQKKDHKKEQENYKKSKGKVTKKFKKVTRETIENYPSFNFEPKYFTLPSRSTSKWSNMSTRHMTPIKQPEMRPENLNLTILQYYDPPNLYPMLIAKATKTNKRIKAKLRDNLIDESNSVNLSNEDTETGIWNVKLGLENKPFYPVRTTYPQHDIPSPTTEIRIMQTELLTPKKDELDPTIVQYYQHQNFSVKMFLTKTKPVLRSPTPLPSNKINLELFKSPKRTHVTHKITVLSYESLDLANKYDDFTQEPIHLGVFKAGTEGTTNYSSIKPIRLGIFAADTEKITAHSRIKPIHLGIFEAESKETPVHSSIKSMHLSVSQVDTERNTAHSSVEPIHLGVFKVDNERITAHSSIELEHLGIFKEHAKGTPDVSDTCDSAIHLGLFKTHAERNQDDRISTVSSTAITTTKTTTRTILTTQKYYPTTGRDTETTTIFPTFDISTLPKLVRETAPKRESRLKLKKPPVKNRPTAEDLVPKPRESDLGKKKMQKLLTSVP